MPLQLAYRPSTLDELYGNEGIKDSLGAVLLREKDQVHAYLLHGPTGCGKTTVARIIASELCCKNPAEYNMANTRGIDTIRDIVNNSRFAPLEGDSRVYILDEAHKLTNDAQNALLKHLEDSPSHVFTILCTTDPEKLIKTIHTRCHTYPLKPLNIPTMVDLLKAITVSEGIESYPEMLIREIAKVSEGLPRKALVLLDSIIDLEDDQKALEAINSFTFEEVTVKEICQLLVKKQGDKWSEMAQLLKNFGGEAEDARYAILGYLNAVLLNKGDQRTADMMTFFMDSFMYNKKAGLSQALYYACNL